ncbi:methionyl-tRNA formyltransferase [Candidatus Saccharibacteria bacterium]|nr:methionyl-tRNA formyltransferase [Candidatus Saccharibacteria bacterium]
MKKTSKPIVFFGSGPVAAKSLELLAENFVIEAVITKPRPAHHKGETPVLDVAARLDIPIKTVSNKKELDVLFENKPFTSTVGVLVDFGIIISQKVIDYFPLGIVNSHFSILPEWRGADPITFAILSGQKKTGVSLMLLVEAMDEGPLLAYAEYDIDENETTITLTENLIQLSNSLLSDKLPQYIEGEIRPVPQSVTGRDVSYSRKLTKQDGVINWSKSAEVLSREVRAFSAWPKSRTVLTGKDVIITKAHAVPGNTPGKKPGDIEESVINDGILMVETTDGRLCIDALKPAGKPEMTGKAFLAGYKNQLLQAN